MLNRGQSWAYRCVRSIWTGACSWPRFVVGASVRLISATASLLVVVEFHQISAEQAFVCLDIFRVRCPQYLVGYFARASLSVVHQDRATDASL